MGGSTPEDSAMGREQGLGQDAVGSGDHDATLAARSGSWSQAQAVEIISRLVAGEELRIDETTGRFYTAQRIPEDWLRP